MIVPVDSDRFEYCNLNYVFRKTQNVFEQLQSCFPVERTTNKNATFPHKIAFSKAIAKTNRQRSRKLLQALPLTTLFF